MPEPVYGRIASYLTVDIQKSPVLKHQINVMQKIFEVQTGVLPSWERLGDACCLHIYLEYIEIEDDYTDEADKIIKVPIATFAAAWREMISHEHTKD